MNLDPRYLHNFGGFDVKIEFSYDAGNPAGSIGQLTHTTTPHMPKRAHGGDYVVRFSGASKTAIRFAHNATSSRSNFEWKQESKNLYERFKILTQKSLLLTVYLTKNLRS